MIEQTGPVSPGTAEVPVDRSWSGRIGRGFGLARKALEIIKQHPSLLSVPLISTAVIVVVFILAAVITGGGAGAADLIVWILALVVMGSISVVGQAVITTRVAASLDGRRLTNVEALEAIRPKLGTLIGWATLSLSVGALIRSLERGRGLFGLVSRLVAIVFVVSWSALTFFVLPVILFEGLGVQAAIVRSREIVRRCWGDGVVGVGALTLLFNLTFLAVLVLSVLLAAAHVLVLAMLLILAAVIGVNLLSAVASPIFTLALYRYATTGETVLDMTPHEMAAAFRPRRRWGPSFGRA